MRHTLFRILMLILLAVMIGSGPIISSAEANSPSSSSNRGWVGIVLGDTDSRPGVTIDTVLRRSPAHGSGIEDGDRVLAVNGRTVRTPGKLQSILNEQMVGRTITIQVEREDQTHDFEVTITPAPRSSQVLRLHHNGFDAPEMALQDLDGNEIDLSARTERPVVIEFWATWCSICRQVSRELEAAVDEAPDAFDVISISSEDPSTVREHLETHPKAHEIAIDEGDLAHDDFLVTGYPFVAVIDTDGKVVDVITNPGDLDSLIANIPGIENEAASDAK